MSRVPVLLAADVGNSRVSLGVFSGERLAATGNFETESAENPRLLVEGVIHFLKGASFSPEAVSAFAVSSVVPGFKQNFVELGRDFLGAPPFWIESRTAGIPLRVDRPDEVGADRLCNAAAAWEKFHQAAIVVDFGTATTLDIVTAKGEYGGGAIFPGLEIAHRSLVQAAAQLQKVPVEKPARVVGRTTAECMQSGLYHGTIGTVDHLVNLSRAEEGCDMKVVATGGLAPLLARDSKTIESVEPHLTLQGIYFIWRKSGTPPRK